MNEMLFNFLYGFAHRSPLVDDLFVISAEYVLGVSFFLFLLVIYKHWRDGRREEIAIVLTISTIGSWLLTQGAKIFFALPRPFETLPGVDSLFEKAGGDSFPSGHATALFAFAAALYLYDKRLGLIAFVVASLTGVARIVSGVHWPSDIIAGALFGMLVAWLVYSVAQWLRKSEKDAKVTSN